MDRVYRFIFYSFVCIASVLSAPLYALFIARVLIEVLKEEDEEADLKQAKVKERYFEDLINRMS